MAQVAYDNLTNKARKQIDAVLGKHGMIYLSTWPDEIKSDTIYPTSFTCHYQDLDGGLTDAEVVAMLTDYPEVGGDLFMALDSLEVVLSSNKQCHDALVESNPYFVKERKYGNVHFSFFEKPSEK